MARLQETAGRIAIVGMSCRFPGAGSIAEYWTNLAAGVESITHFSSEDASGRVDGELLRGRIHVKAAGVLDRVEQFDADFFGFTPREARAMDPQIRLFLECAWEALEDAGHAGAHEGAQVGVYAGANISGYLLSNLCKTLAPMGSAENLMTLTANDKDYLATHVSYKLNLKGPSINVQTACSTSLVAVHTACQALLNHECDLALAGAVTVRVPHRFGYVYEEGGILSPDGHCRAFDADGQGTVPGSGAGVAVLKRLADALEDHDSIYAVIRGSAVNNDGSGKMGFTAPSVEGQAEVIAQAQAMAGVSAESIDYVEAHGTGTPLGDACEIAALSQVFEAATQAKGFCGIGSVKTNIGHLEAASGMAGLIKTVLALKHEMIPPTLHFEKPNSNIDFARSAFIVNASPREWKRTGRPRLAGVSSFGVGGTNAHLIVEEAPATTPSAIRNEMASLLTLSAKSRHALRSLVERFDQYLSAAPEPLGDICFTANTGRRHFAHRFTAVAESAEEMRGKLDSFLRSGEGGTEANLDSTETGSWSIEEPGREGRRRALEKLAEAYARGAAIEWATLYSTGQWRRVNLPTYPFQRKRYWIEPAVTADPLLEDSIYSLQWQSTPKAELRQREGGDWLILGGSALADALARCIRESGERCTVSTEIAAIGPSRRVIYLGPLGCDLDESVRMCEGVVKLMQAAAALTPPARLWLVTRGAQTISEADRVTAPWQATIWGLGRVFALEHPESWGGLIDLPSGTWENEVSALWAEIHSPDGEDQVALRSAGRFAPRLTRSAQMSETAVRVQPNATYLITGGTGGLGLKVAEWLAEAGARQLVLCGRRGMADVRRIEALGAKVVLARADVTDIERMAALFGEIRESGRPLRGVVHAAGVWRPRAIQDLDAETLRANLNPKVAGAWNLHRLTEAMDLDFFVCFSSVASVWGAHGFGAYAAGNQFLDSLMAHRRAAGRPALSINWGPWEEHGMSARESGASLARTGLAKIDSGTALGALGRLLAHGVSQALVAQVDWRVFKPAYEARRARPLLERMEGGSSDQGINSELVRLLQAAPPEKRRAELDRYLEAAVAKALGLDAGHRIDPRNGFFDLGMDSLLAVEFRNRLQSAVGDAVALPRTLLFDYPTLEALRSFLAERMLGASALSPATPVKRDASGPIAVIGVGCRFPGGADDPASFWRLMCERGDAVTEVPADRWRVDDYYDDNADAAGKTFSRYGAFVPGVHQFDPAFFGIAPREAASMDPQQRLVLEVAWEALENAGCPPELLAGTRSGVFIGISTNDYLQLMMRSGDFQHLDSYAGIGNVLSAAAGRLSYVLGLQGPSMAVDTACSSSLAAVHLAIRSLRSGECDLALAGGVNLILSPAVHVNLSRARMLSRDGRSKAFDEEADGFVRGEGCGIVVLKRLSDALDAGDRVLAVIHGSAVNQDGRSSGITVPNGMAQRAVIREALADGGIEPSEVDYVEAHGTGTSLGDPIEVQALAAVLGEGREHGNKVAIGSVKTNIGHLEAAAGIAGLIKVVLSLDFRSIPPQGYLRKLNPHLSWSELPVEVLTAQRHWEPTAGKRRIGAVSAFGFSGTNVHVVIGEAPEFKNVHRALRVHHLSLSAKSEATLRALAVRYDRFLAETTADLGDICYSAEAGRSAFAHRVTVLGKSVEEMRSQLLDWRAGTIPSVATGNGFSYSPKEYRKVALPTYPFERQRCWFQAGEDERLYKIAWEPVTSRRERLAVSGEWAIVADSGGVAGALRSLLESRGISCRVLNADEREAPLGQTVVYLAGLDATAPGEATCCAPMLQWVQELVRRRKEARLWCVTRGAQPVETPAILNVAQAPLWGFGRVVSLEHPKIWGGLIDLEDSTDADAAAMIAHHILHFDGEDQVAFRNGVCFAPRLSRDSDLSAGAPRIEPDSWYLITGGLGGLGIQMAQWLVHHGARRLVLTGRGGMTGSAATAVANLEGKGASVQAVASDVQDYSRMAELIDRVQNSSGPLRGVIHAAGVLERRSVLELDSRSLNAVMGPKVAGAWNLHRLTAGEKLDFFVLCSSVAGVWGSVNMGAYAAANHFLDALAHYRQGLGLPALSMSWGAWNLGMTTRSDSAWLERSGMTGFSAQEGIDVFGSLLGSQSAHRIAVDVDWGVFQPVITAKAARPFFAKMFRSANARGAGTSGDSDFLQALKATPVDRRIPLLADRIREEVARVMGIGCADAVDPGQGFFDMGMDSLMAVELRKCIEILAGTPLESSVIFNYSNVEELAKQIGCRLAVLEPPTKAGRKDRIYSEHAEIPIEELSEAEAEMLLARELAAREENEIG